MNYRFHPQAEAELYEAYDWCEEQPRSATNNTDREFNRQDTVAKMMMRPPTSGMSLTLLLSIVLSGCGSNGHLTEDDFPARTDEEQEAKERIQYWVGKADELLADSVISQEQKETLRQAIARTRAALSDYNNLRNRGAYRGVIMAPVRLSAAGILADDATGVGFADDVLLIPLALAAIATYAITDAPASQEELTRAWNDTLVQVGELGAAVDGALMLAAPGNVADTGIMAEVHERIASARIPPDDDSICRVLAELLDAATRAKDKKRIKRIQTTQKARDCRKNRHRRGL